MSPRSDIKQVICERERSGDRGNGYPKGYEREHRPKNKEDREDYGDLEALPKKESMTKRLGWDKRRFSDRLGAIQGLVRKAKGKRWDKVYSELCKLVSPTGTTVERHVHEHVDQYICRETRVGPDGTVEGHGTTGRTYSRFGLNFSWGPINEIRQDFYVCPKDGTVKEVKRKKVKTKDWRTRQNEELNACYRATTDPLMPLHRIFGTWYWVKLEPVKFVWHVDPMTGIKRRHQENTDVVTLSIIESRRAQSRALEHTGLHSGDLVAVWKRALSSRDLKRYKLENVSQSVRFVTRGGKLVAEERFTKRVPYKPGTMLALADEMVTVVSDTANEHGRTVVVDVRN